MHGIILVIGNVGHSGFMVVVVAMVTGAQHKHDTVPAGVGEGPEGEEKSIQRCITTIVETK